MKKAWPWIVTVAALLWCIVIWQFSFRDGGTSSQTSGSVLKSVNEFFSKIGIENPFTPKTIRKTAHFFEFFLLGVLSSAALCLHGFRHYAILSALCVLAVGGVDEIIQIFIPGRGPSFLDVLLDTAGGIAGISLFCLAIFTISTLQERGKDKKRDKFQNNSK